MLGALTVAGQEPATCEEALVLAEKSFELGLFEDVSAQVAPCLQGSVPRRTAIQSHSLLARAYLYADEPEKARREVSSILRLDSTFEAASPPAFAALIARVRREEQTTQVASVSKSSESLREAPATVVVVTGDEIRRRGYLDLEDLLHDLPGFDPLRSNGEVYSYLNLRGYRSDESDRLLFLVDGVEQNELSTNSLYLSRQYPISNIDRVEVVYGPASTMYGANAYTGVVSLITKDAESLLGERKTFSLVGQATGGGYGSGHFDLTMSGRNRAGTIAWFLAGSFQKSKERDLSGFPDYDYTYTNFDYAAAMRLTGAEANEFIAAGGCQAPSEYFECDAAEQRVELTPKGVTLVRELDRALIREQNLGFDDRARNWSAYAKLRISNLTIGLQTWESREGSGSNVSARMNSGSDAWTPRQLAFYVKYSLPLERVKFSFFTRYIQSSLDRTNTSYHYFRTFARGNLNLWSFVPPCETPLDPAPIACEPPSTPWARQVFYGMLSNQLRAEGSVVYESSEKLKGVAGFELAKSSIQSTFDERSVQPMPRDPALAPRPEQIEHSDVAVYAQGAYKPARSLKFILAGRITHNTIDNRRGSTGFGTLFTPRAGVIYMPQRSLVLKAIYSEAFKDPTDYQKFATIHFFFDFPGGNLKPERARNLEWSAGWEPDDRWSSELSLYQTRYSDVVVLTELADCDPNIYGCLQYQNRSGEEIRSRGAQWTARYRHPRFEFWSHYTHTAAYRVNPRTDFGDPLIGDDGNVIRRIVQADVARNRWSAGVDVNWSDRLKSGARVRYVGRRPTGPGTTQPDSPLSSVDPYATLDAVVGYRISANDLALQLIVGNILDEQYTDPTLTPDFGPAGVLQAGRTVYLRVAYGFPSGWSGR